MSAYIIVELTVRDTEAKNRYSTAAAPILKSFGGSFIAGGPLTMLYGDEKFANGAIIQFDDRQKALDFYNSSGYQALLADREVGIDSRFSLLG